MPDHSRLLWWSVVGTLAMLTLAAVFATGISSQSAHLLGRWNYGDAILVVTAAIASMGCALPGVFLVLRRQSMMGDALSHTVLPGIVLALLLEQWLLGHGNGGTHGSHVLQTSVLFVGAMAIGILAALLTETCRKFGDVESSAALGVVFTTLFAIGIVLIRAFADQVHLDPDCVLYGYIERLAYTSSGVPTQTYVVGTMFLANLLLVVVFFKELRASAFDASFATSIGVHAQLIHYALMAVTAATLVASFRIVGSILVIAMLIAPAATASLLTDRLSSLIGLSLVIAAATAVLGHAMATVVPPLLLTYWPFRGVDPQTIDASTAGMMAAAGGVLFVAALLFAPRYGLVTKLIDRITLSLRIAGEDVLGWLYRCEEQTVTPRAPRESAWNRLAIRWLNWHGLTAAANGSLSLTDNGRIVARDLVRSHRLWETYLAENFALPEDHLHQSAERVEHFMDAETRARLAEELRSPARDPHGKDIPTPG